MSDIQSIAQDLLELDEEELTAQIGARAEAIETSPKGAAQGEFESVESLEEEIPVARGAFDDFLKTGQDIFASASLQAYKLLCSPVGGDSELAEELDKLMGEKTTEAAAKMASLLAPVLVGSLGLPQSIAVLVGTLIVKKVAKGTSDFVCENWKSSLAKPEEME
jgi:hypothetical protein